MRTFPRDIAGDDGLHGSTTCAHRSTDAFIGSWAAVADWRGGANSQCGFWRGNHSNSCASQIACVDGGEGAGQRPGAQ